MTARRLGISFSYQPKLTNQSKGTPRSILRTSRLNSRSRPRFSCGLLKISGLIWAKQLSTPTIRPGRSGASLLRFAHD
jgi:hypothetical protein